VKRLLRSPDHSACHLPQLLRESQITSKEGLHDKAGLTESKPLSPSEGGHVVNLRKVRKPGAALLAT